MEPKSLRSQLFGILEALCEKPSISHWETMNDLSSTPYPPKIVMAYRRGHGKSTYRCTTSAQCHGTKTGPVPDCSALRYWESGTEGERVSVIESALFPGHIELWRPNPRKRASANGPESGWLVVIRSPLPGHCDLGMQGSCSDSAIVLCLRRPMPCAAGSSIFISYFFKW